MISGLIIKEVFLPEIREFYLKKTLQKSLQRKGSLYKELNWQICQLLAQRG